MRYSSPGEWEDDCQVKGLPLVRSRFTRTRGPSRMLVNQETLLEHWYQLGYGWRILSGSPYASTLMQLSGIENRDLVQLLSLCRGVIVSLYLLCRARSIVIRAVVT